MHWSPHGHERSGPGGEQESLLCTILGSFLTLTQEKKALTSSVNFGSTWGTFYKQNI